jgi:diaminopimelate epimerase
VRFEKWQALGNDYLIFEEASLTPDHVQKLCDPHFGPGADGVLILSRPDEPGYVARLRIFNPDGSEAELSGNGAREAILYLRRAGWTDADTFSIQTAAGEIRPTITSATTCRVDMGRATLSSPHYPHGPPDGRGRIEANGTTFDFQHVAIGNPQCAIRVEDPDALDLRTLGPEIEHAAIFPNRTNVSFWKELAPDTIRARIFERGVGETLSSGTGASGAAVAHVVRGGDSPVTVRLDGGELTVEVDESLHVDLTGWAVPIYRAELSEEFMSQLEIN